MRRNLSRRFLISVLSLFAMIASLKTAAGEDTSTPTGSEWKAPARAAKKQNPVPLDANSMAQGKVVYIRECLSCHGEHGKGDGPSAKGLEKSPGDLTDSQRISAQSDGELFWKISEGKTPMPTLRKTLTDEERWQVVHYIRTFVEKKKEGKEG